MDPEKREKEEYSMNPTFCLHTTEHFAVLEPQNPKNGEFYEVHLRRSPDFLGSKTAERSVGNRRNEKFI